MKGMEEVENEKKEDIVQRDEGCLPLTADTY
jgi:hypothetical protein